MISVAVPASAKVVGHEALCPGTARLPFVALDGIRPAVRVSVNGTGPYVFLFDTGAEGEGRADTLLTTTLSLPAAGVYANSDAASVAQIKQVRLARLNV